MFLGDRRPRDALQGRRGDGVIFLDAPRKTNDDNPAGGNDREQPDWPARRYRKKTA